MQNDRKHLSVEQKGHLDAVLTDAGKKFNCSRKDLEWKFDKYGAIHIRKKDAGKN